LLREFELDRPAGLLLNDRRAVARPAAEAQIVDLQTDEVAPARVDLKPGPDIPNFLWLQGALPPDESTFFFRAFAVIPSTLEKDRWVPLRPERRRLTPADAFASDESEAKADGISPVAG
jgi:hypothetical protein